MPLKSTSISGYLFWNPRVKASLTSGPGGPNTTTLPSFLPTATIFSQAGSLTDAPYAMADETNTSTIRTGAINRSRRCISFLLGGAFKPNTPVLQHSISENLLALLPIRHRRHAGWNTGLGQLGFVNRADFPRLILVIHHRTAFTFRDGGEIIFADATLAAPQGQMQPGFRAGGKVRVIPSFRRHQQAALAPVDFYKRFLSRVVFRPHEGVTLAAQHNHLRAGAMVMGLSISAAADGHDMTDHRFVTRAGDSKPAVIDAAPRIFGQRHGVNIRNEIDRGILELPLLDLARKIVVLTREPISEFVGRIENKLGRSKSIENNRRIARRDKAHRLGRRAVEMLVLDVERRRKKAARLPLKQNRLVGLLAPELRRAAAFENQDQLLVKMAHGLQIFSWRNLRNHGANESLRALEVTVGGGAAKALPMAERDRAQVLHPIARDNRQSFGVAKFQERRLTKK